MYFIISLTLTILLMNPCNKVLMLFIVLYNSSDVVVCAMEIKFVLGEVSPWQSLHKVQCKY